MSKPLIIFAVVIYYLLIAIVCSSVGIEISGAVVSDVPIDGFLINTINVFIGLLSFRAVGVPDFVILFFFYAPSLIVLGVVYEWVRGV